VALRVEQNIARFKISVDQLSGVHILESLEELIDDEFLVNLFQNACPNDDMKIYDKSAGTCLHIVEY
jgi:hypothetical protein